MCGCPQRPEEGVGFCSQHPQRDSRCGYCEQSRTVNHSLTSREQQALLTAQLSLQPASKAPAVSQKMRPTRGIQLSCHSRYLKVPRKLGCSSGSRRTVSPAALGSGADLTMTGGYTRSPASPPQPHPQPCRGGRTSSCLGKVHSRKQPIRSHIITFNS